MSGQQGKGPLEGESLPGSRTALAAAGGEHPEVICVLVTVANVGKKKKFT